MNNGIIIVDCLIQRDFVPHPHCLGPAAPAYQNASWSKVSFDSPSISSGWENSAFRLTSPVDSPDSNKLIGRMVSHVKRPVPEWVISFVSGGTAEPVSTNWPNSPR